MAAYLPFDSSSKVEATLENDPWFAVPETFGAGWGDKAESCLEVETVSPSELWRSSRFAPRNPDSYVANSSAA